MTTIRVEFPTIPTRSNMGIGAMKAASLTAMVVDFVIPAQEGDAPVEDREAMYARMFA